MQTQIWLFFTCPTRNLACPKHRAIKFAPPCTLHCIFHENYHGIPLTNYECSLCPMENKETLWKSKINVPRKLTFKCPWNPIGGHEKGEHLHEYVQKWVCLSKHHLLLATHCLFDSWSRLPMQENLSFVTLTTWQASYEIFKSCVSYIYVVQTLWILNAPVFSEYFTYHF